MDRDVRIKWVEQIRNDYGDLCYSYSVKLPIPVIRVEPLHGKWGYWDPEVRTITLSSRLISEYPWEIVREVLKHEMAHQIVSDIFGSDELHGPLFQKACDKLGVASWARRSQTDLDVPLLVKETSSPEEERLLRRAEKLLALASSTNEHEAVLAMQRVRELYAKYNIDRLSSLKTHRNHAHITISLKRKRAERYQLAIASLLNDYFFVEIIHSHIFDAVDCCEYKTIEVLGTPENVQLAEYVFHFLQNQLPGLWSQYQNESLFIRRTSGKLTFFLGVILGFREKLEKQESKDLSTAKALTLVKNPDLAAFVKYRYPKLSKVTRGSLAYDPSVFEAGKSKGNDIVLHRGIKQSDGNLGRLLPK